MFKLHPQLEKDCFILGEFRLCTLLLLNDANYPWFILVPNRDNISEMHQLSTADQQQFMAESTVLSHGLEHVFQPDKLNIAALGNIVPQLHIHHIARFSTDISWPAPVWGAAPAIIYQTNKVKSITNQIVSFIKTENSQIFHKI